MRRFFSKRAFFAYASIPKLSRASTVHLSRPLSPIASFFSATVCPADPSSVAAAAGLLSPRRGVHVAPQDVPKPLPGDLATGLTQDGRVVETVPEEGEDEDGPMNEFLSRFVWMMRPKLVDAFPDSDKETLDGMLLIVAQKVVSEMEEGGGVLPSRGISDTDADLSPDLWKEVLEVSKAAYEETRRTRRREEMRKFLHCGDVKEMCRFASESGIRGDMLRELRFKWAYEKLEESEFYRNLERIKEEDYRLEELSKRESADVAASNIVDEGGKHAEETEKPTEETEKPTLKALPQRKGKLKYKIHGLDLSDHKWEEVADGIYAAERRTTMEAPQPIMGKCKMVTEKILNLKEEEDPHPLLANWAEILRPKKADWLALLERINENNPAMYFKVAELVFDEESFQAATGDYSKLMDAYAKSSRVEDVERIYQKMIQKGINPDIRVLLIMLHMYCSAGILDRAEKAFESLTAQGFQPDVETYKSMIVAYVNAGRPKPAEALLRKMEAMDIKPTLEMYMVLLQSCARHGLVDAAQRMFNNMQFSGIQPNLEACTLLLEAYGNAGDPNQARNSFDFILKAGHKPDDRCVACMIAVYEKNNLLDKALDLLLNLEKDRFQPGIATYSVLVDWLGKLLLVDEVEQLLDKIRELGDAPFHVNVSLCSMYARACMKNKSGRYLKRLEEKKELLSAEQFETVIDGLISGKFVDEAERMIGAMQTCGFSLPELLKKKLGSIKEARYR